MKMASLRWSFCRVEFLPSFFCERQLGVSFSFQRLDEHTLRLLVQPLGGLSLPQVFFLGFSMTTVDRLVTLRNFFGTVWRTVLRQGW